jgi:hypothetical protein
MRCCPDHQNSPSLDVAQPTGSRTYGFRGGSSRSANVCQAEDAGKVNWLSLSQANEKTRRYETVPCVLDPNEKRQLIEAMASEFGGDLPFDEEVRILTRVIAPERDPDVRAMYADGRIYNRAGRLNIKLSDTRGLKLTIAAAIAANLMAHDATTETAAIVLAAAADRVRILKDDELEVFDVMLDLSYGRIYKVWVGEDQLIESLSSNGDTDDRRRLPARMKSKGILEEGAGRWRAVR